MGGLRRLSLVLLALALGAVFAASGAALRAETVIERLVSPGPLSPAHARLETRCNACHVSFHKQAQNGQCLSCHTGIARDLASRTRWHGIMAQGQSCRSCHVEHRGTSQGLVLLDRAHFHHDRQTAYRLTGAHVRTSCVACHKGMVRFRETPQACVACHVRQDVHRGGLGPSCQSCHTTARWRDVLPFDHDRTHYPLTGAHRTVACLGCHVGEHWKGVSTACAACHVKQDVHRGADGPRCETCHGTANWRTIAFDHDKVAAFPLRGAHRILACVTCHPRTVRPDRAPVPCIGCHVREDVHKGADGPKCESCHSQATWKVATFDHARTGFPLIGHHVRVACVACHPKSVDKVKVGSQCIDCHRKDDVHKGTFGTVCEGCHKPTGFRIGNRVGLTVSRPASGPMSHPMSPPAQPANSLMRDFPRSGLRD